MVLALGCCDCSNKSDTHKLSSAIFGPVGPASASLSQATWYIDRVAGLSSNSGVDSAHPVDSAATIWSRWTGGVAGARPVIPASVSSITITWLKEAAAQPDVSDPVSVLLDVSFGGSTTLLFQSASQTVSYSGTLASVSAFARTASSGQILVTDTGISNYQPYVPLLIHDKTTGAVGWLYEPQVSSATGKISKGKVAETAGILSTPVDATVATGDAYEILTPPRIYMGNYSLSSNVGLGPSGGGPLIYFYRLWATSQAGGAFGDSWTPSTSNTIGTGPIIDLQESRFDQQVQAAPSGILRISNSALTAPLATGAQGASANGVMQLLAGFSYGAFQTALSGEIEVDCDFLLDGNGQFVAQAAGNIFLGAWSRWGTTGPAVVSDFGSLVSAQNIFTSIHTEYGTVGASNPVYQVGFYGNVLYAGAGTAVATFGGWDSNVTNFTLQGSGNSGWGFDQATGKYAGTADGSSAANTWANLDAAINSPGFLSGGHASASSPGYGAIFASR